MSTGSHRKRFRESREFDLPERAIQLIQSFLSSKQAARTTLLSKSWRSAWLTRPNLDFDITDFNPNPFEPSPSKFLDFAVNTLERYENSNLGIDSFRMSMRNRLYPPGFGTTAKLVNIALVHRALKLGPTRLTFESEIEYTYSVIPDEVFRYQNLVSLTAMHGFIDLKREGCCCSRLRSLCLNYVCIKSYDVISRIISSCPLIEKLSLRNVEVNFGGDDDGMQTSISPLCRLKSLVLENVEFDTLFLADLSTIFPSLEDLTLSITKDREEILISSPTLERLDFRMEEDYNVQRVKLDVPSIRKLTFVCSSIPDELSVKSNSRGWDSFISVTGCERLSVSWFYRLSHFIRNLRFSRISLSLNVYSGTTFNYEPGDVQGLSMPEVENLNIYHEHLTSLSCYALFDGLFRICHPNVITQYMSKSYVRSDSNNIHFLGKRLLDARDVKVPTPYHFMYGLNDLKEVRIQAFDEELDVWRPEESIDVLPNYKCYSPTPEEFRHQKVRFRLEWKR